MSVANGSMNRTRAPPNHKNNYHQLNQETVTKKCCLLMKMTNQHRRLIMVSLLLARFFWSSLSTSSLVFSNMHHTTYDHNPLLFIQQKEDEEKNGSNSKREQEEDQQKGEFAACLLIMDENHRLPEWLAYHYYMLPLRHLVVLVDPRSETSPMEIINRWKNHLTIDVWNHAHLLSLLQKQEDESERHKSENRNQNHKEQKSRRLILMEQELMSLMGIPRSSNMTSLLSSLSTVPSSALSPTALAKKHRFLQPRFYEQCGMYLRQIAINKHQAKTTENKTLLPRQSAVATTPGVTTTLSPTAAALSLPPPLWITFHDIDEYIYLVPGVVPNAEERMSKPGSVRTFMQELLQQQQEHQNPRKKQREKKPTSSSSLSQRFTQFTDRATSSHCFFVERTYFGAIEPADPKLRYQQYQRNVPTYLNGSDFETLRYIYRTSHSDAENNGPGKSIAFFDFSELQNANDGHWNNNHEHDNEKGKDKTDEGVDNSLFQWNSESPHRVFKDCPANLRRFVPIRIRHYLGSWEAYTSRVDSRVGVYLSREMYLYRATTMGNISSPDDAVRPWIQGFCDLFQNNQSLIESLLQGVGKIPVNYTNSPKIRDTQWSFSPELIHRIIHNPRTGKFKQWLAERFEVTPVENSTATTGEEEPKWNVKVRPAADGTMPESYPYTFPPMVAQDAKT